MELKSLRNLCMLITSIASVDVFLFFVNMRDEPALYTGVITHLFLLIIASKQWNCWGERPFYFLAAIIGSYLLIIPMYLYPHDDGLAYLLINILFLIPLLINYHISNDIKQLTVLSINTMMVIGFCQRCDLLCNRGLTGDSEPIQSVFTAIDTLLYTIISLALIQIKFSRKK
ncbi:MAG: hypothetical protein MJZ29_02200 [Bacteroidaceae bacterium]|nr:hypothetical protein [Bacteroidaceae bacterium]